MAARGSHRLFGDSLRAIGRCFGVVGSLLYSAGRGLSLSCGGLCFLSRSFSA